VAAALIKSREATEAPQTGWSVRPNCFAGLTTPSAPLWNGAIL